MLCATYDIWYCWKAWGIRAILIIHICNYTFDSFKYPIASCFVIDKTDELICLGFSAEVPLTKRKGLEKKDAGHKNEKLLHPFKERFL